MLAVSGKGADLFRRLWLVGVAMVGASIPVVGVEARAASQPAVTLPSLTLPTVTTGSVTVPSVTVPSVIVPSVTVPSVTVPMVIVPSVTTPSISTPSVSSPPVDAPVLPRPTAPSGAIPGPAARPSAIAGSGAPATGGAPASDRSARAGTGRGRSTAAAGASRRGRAGRRALRILRRDRALRHVVLRLSSCLGRMPRTERRVLVLRAGVGIAHTRSRREVARIIGLGGARVATLERRSLRRLRALAHEGACAAASAPAPVGLLGGLASSRPPAPKGIVHLLAELPSGGPRTSAPVRVSHGGVSIGTPTGPVAGSASGLAYRLLALILGLTAIAVIVVREVRRGL
jgi:hypothetical protein